MRSCEQMTNNPDLTVDNRVDSSGRPALAPPAAAAIKKDPAACGQCDQKRPVMVQMLGNWFLCSKCWIEGRQPFKLGRVRVVKS